VTRAAPTTAATRRRRGPGQVRAELRSLAAGEAVSAAVLPSLLVALAWPADPVLVPLLAASSALAAVLATAAAFWRLRARGHLTTRQARVVARTMACCAAVAAAALLGAALTPRHGQPLPHLVAVGTAAFTLVEWVNYRWAQITARGWRAWFHGHVVRPHLARELDRAARPVPVPTR